MAVGTHYRGKDAQRYFAWQRDVGEIGARLNVAKFASHVASTDIVLDFGCGAGGLLANLECSSRVGVEASAPAREIAAARGFPVYESIDQVDDGFVDVVISNHALEHTLSPFDELERLHRVLRPGGRLVLCVPIDDWRNEATPASDRNHHLFTWTPLLLHNLLTETGFDVADVRVLTHAWPPATRSLMRLPRPAFDQLARAWAVVRRRRQLIAVAYRLVPRESRHVRSG